MKPLVIICLGVSVLAMLLPSFCCADLAPPNRDPTPRFRGPKSHALVIQVDPEVKVATLRIPRHFLADQGGAGPGNADRGTSGLLNPGRTVVAGVMLSAAAVGLLLMRRRRVGRVLAAVMLCLAVLGTASLTWADRAPNAPPATPAAGPVSNVVLEIVDKGDAILLILSPAALSAQVGAQPVNSPATSK